MKRSVINKILCLMAALAIAVMSAAALLGCSWFSLDSDYAEFAQSRLELAVGDEYDLTRLLVTNNGNYTLTSSVPSVAKLNGNTVTALKEGISTVTATCPSSQYTSSIHISVSESNSFAIDVEGELNQTIGATGDIVFKPVATGAVKAGYVKWLVDESQRQISTAIENFVFTPSTVGTTVIKGEIATNSKYCDTKTVNVYMPVTASGSAAGEFTQTGPTYTPITFSAAVSSVPNNPADNITWRIDGKTVYSGTDNVYVYRPTPGLHTVTLYVNGVKRKINGGTELTLTCYGSIVPGTPDILYDNMYPHVYLTHNVVGKAKVEITSPNGTVTEYSERDARYTYMFGSGRVDVGSLISLCAVGQRRTYKFRIKSLGDGGALTESDYSDYFSFYQLPAAAASYISNIYQDRDHYLTSDEEYVNAFEYYVIHRPKTGALAGGSNVEFNCYLGYTPSYTADELWHYAFKVGATSGSYTGVGAEYRSDRTVIHSEFTVSTVNNPSRETYSVVKEYLGEYSTPLHSNLPHINYDSAKYRPDSYAFPIDKLTRTQSVRYSDELYLAAENNSKPVPATGSAADTIYKTAKKILRQIITDDMTDVQKAHAIYDWIMWQVTYDTPATQVKSNGESYSAYYLEGVFGDGKTSIGGVKYNPYAVCDGMSKAYSLMCNIEGIPCVRVAGMAGDGKNAGGHAWNKVYVAGAWYIVDCTWGDSVSNVTIDGKTASYEFGLHDWLFVTDSYASETHYEPYMYSGINDKWGECEIRYAPVTSCAPYPVYTEWTTYNGTKINCEIGYGVDPLTRAKEIATEFAHSYTPMASVYVPGGKNSGVYSVNYVSIEMHFAYGCDLTKETLKRELGKVVTAVRPRAKYDVFKYDDVVLLLIK